MKEEVEQVWGQMIRRSIQVMTILRCLLHFQMMMSSRQWECILKHGENVCSEKQSVGALSWQMALGPRSFQLKKILGLDCYITSCVLYWNFLRVIIQKEGDDRQCQKESTEFESHGNCNLSWTNLNRCVGRTKRHLLGRVFNDGILDNVTSDWERKLWVLETSRFPSSYTV